MPSEDQVDAPGSPQRFSYTRPESERGKKIVVLGRTDRLLSAVQVLKSGGENNLHSHADLDGFWFVLNGGVRFYTADDEVLCELALHDGVIIPRGYPYWFEQIGDEPLELLQVEASSRPRATLKDFASDRIDRATPSAETIGLTAAFGDGE